MEIVRDLVSLLYPRLCAGCHVPLARGEKQICATCFLEFPETHFHRERDNPCTRIFAGRLEVEAAAAFCYFDKGGHVQNMLHAIKYEGAYQLAVLLGKIYGKRLRKTLEYWFTDMIVPVPLHPLRLRTRGYNQSEAFGKGLSESLDVALFPEALRRVVNTSTQTKKSKDERWENVKDIFEVVDIDGIRGRSVLIVDDVITTGATIEACGKLLLEAGASSVKIAAIACSMKI